jgi:pyruvate/2-oxoglutarate dehydrogenase complex dihydrolipoamide acyltransferase (E2) component
VCILCAAFDHRVMDGLLAAKLAKFAARYLADPAKFEQRAAARRTGDQTEQF